MGQCMSRKAAGAFAASAAASHNRPTKMQKHRQSPDEENNKERICKKPGGTYKGASMSFGFKRRPTTAPIASNTNAARRLANNNTDSNGNDNDAYDVDDAIPLTSNIAPTGRTTPRLMPPKKEGIATKVNRFGFRQPQINRLDKVADLNAAPIEFSNNNVVKTRPYGQNRVRTVTNFDNNRNRTRIGATTTQAQAERFTLQTTQLPRPVPIKMIETKTAKTLANNSRKNANIYHEDNSSKDSEDSGFGSHISSGLGDAVKHLKCSPTYGVRRNTPKTRNLEIFVSGNSFDVRDLDETTDNSVALPQLPSAFSSRPDYRRSSYQSTGFVRERAQEYQRHIELSNRRKISVTSSEGFSDDYGEEQKTYKDKYRNEKSFLKPNLHKTFLKSKLDVNDSSPASSDEHEWTTHGGEAMADEISFSISSSDESKEKDIIPHFPNNIASVLQTLVNSQTKPEARNVVLTIEDPKFAAVAAAASTNATFLDDETSPIESLLSSESDEINKRKMNRSSSNSKDINEKLTPPTPGTPTNASNSLSLSDGKDDFLIDDEIADQPALLFEDTISITNNETIALSQTNSENTIVDSTPKPKRRFFTGIEGSPLMARNKKLLNSRTASLDTLSPCESIASDDLMMDFDYSQSSGLEEVDKIDGRSNGFLSLDEMLLKSEAELNREVMKDWSSMIGGVSDKPKSNVQNSRLLRSRTSNSDSPRSLDSKINVKSRPSATSSPLRLARPCPISSTGYDSDDSIRLDRANHTAMKQDIMSMKTMLLKLRRVLNEQPDEDKVMRSETHIPFDGQMTLTNGLFNGLCSDADVTAQNDDCKFELAELRRQVLFLQGQLEDKEKTVQTLQEQMVKLTSEHYTSNSAPASTVTSESTCNAATQTERIRPISAGPLLNGSSVDGSIGSLVSVSKTRKSPVSGSPSAARRTQSRLWRKPGEPPSPQRYTNNQSALPRRANSRTRTPPSTAS